MNKKLWEWSAKPINMEIFSIGDLEPDNSPPDFKMYSEAVRINIIILSLYY